MWILSQARIFPNKHYDIGLIFVKIYLYVRKSYSKKQGVPDVMERHGVEFLNDRQRQLYKHAQWQRSYGGPWVLTPSLSGSAGVRMCIRTPTF